jgi:hypothetical protein
MLANPPEGVTLYTVDAAAAGASGPAAGVEARPCMQACMERSRISNVDNNATINSRRKDTNNTAETEQASGSLAPSTTHAPATEQLVLC